MSLLSRKSLFFFEISPIHQSSALKWWLLAVLILQMAAGWSDGLLFGVYNPHTKLLEKVKNEEYMTFLTNTTWNLEP